MRGLVVAAARTGSGKTTLTLALLRALRRRGLDVASAKIGPDFIDPRYHAAAAGAPCVNLDGWAMRAALLARLVESLRGRDFVLVEGVMGLFDAAERPGLGTGSTAEMAKALGLPVLLVLDAGGMGQSIAALAAGFARHDPALALAGLVLNNVGSERHRRILREALRPMGLPVFGMLPRDPVLARASRHLGLVQADEDSSLEEFLDRAANCAEGEIDLEAILEAARPISPPPVEEGRPLFPPVPPLGHRIAVASDVAFRFAYPHLLEGWREAGAEIVPFSPVADQAPDAAADAVYLPGGYPELHAGRLAAADRFLSGLASASRRGATIYGECGGYMVLGCGLVDASGDRHAMAGLLANETTFADRKLSLGYRHVELVADGPLGPTGAGFRAHEFHYSRVLTESGTPLFRSPDDGARFGLREGRVSGSWLHLIDRSEPETGLAMPAGPAP